MKLEILWCAVLDCFLISALPDAITNRNDKEIELVQVLFRHGERTISEEEYSILNYTDLSVYQPFGLAQLTNNGKNQAYKVGQVLRKLYNGYLNETYNPEDVYAYTSEKDRTKMSLELTLAGLYPPSDDLLWNPQLRWIPIPYRYTPLQLDVLLRPRYSKKFKSLLSGLSKLPFYVAKKAEYSDVVKLLREKANIHEDNWLDNLRLVFNVLLINKRLNIPLPEWFSDDLFEKLKLLELFLYDCMTHTEEMRRLIAGPLVKTFLQNMNLDEKFYNPRKIYLYSGSDTNFAAVVRALKVEGFSWPDFSSTLILEKLRDSERHLYVRLLGWYGIEEKLKVLKIGKCEKFCPINDFLKMIKNSNVMPSSIEMNYLVDDFEGSIDNLLLSDPLVKHP